MRFPEFVRELSLKKLEEISTWASGGTPSKENASFWNGTIPWISASSMHGVEYSNSNLKITEEGLKSGSKLAKKNTLLLLVRGSMLFNRIPVGITTKDVAFNQDVKSILIDDKKGNAKYILYWFFHSEQRIKHLVTGTGIGAGKLDMSDLKSLKVKLPTIPEQIKIATFLTSIDERINTQSKIIEHQESLMKGMMQEVFTQQLQFKDGDGNKYPDWEIIKISNICNVVKGKQLNKEELTKIGTYPAINGGIEPSGYSEEWNTNENTITISEGGNSCGYVNFIKTKFWSGGHCYSLLNLGNGTDVRFLYQYLKYNQVRIMKLRVGSGLPNIQKGDITNFRIQLPSIQEQTKIANFLSSLDDKLEKEKQVLKQYQQQKKHLLQNLFI